MLSKKWSIIVIGNFAVAFSCFVEAAPVQSQAQSQPKTEAIPYNLHDEADKTDIYDIPVQNDEEDIEEEMEELNQAQRPRTIEKK